MDRNAFGRAWQFLSYSPAAKWGGLVAAVGSGVLYAALLVLLLLFADLIDWHGQVPSYFHLSGPEQQALGRRWDALPPAARAEALGKFGTAADPEKVAWADLSAEQKAAAWHGSNWLLLRDRVSARAADAYAAPPSSALARDLQPPSNGLLSLVVRSQNSWSFPLVAVLAMLNPWTFTNVLGPDPDSSYLAGLLIAAVVTATLRAVLMNLTNTFAAFATMEAATRMRRLIYHHTFRLGTLAIRSLGPGEAVSLFVRHIEAVSDAMYARLTVGVREPVKFLLVLALALTLNFWLAAAGLILAALVWLAGGQVAVWYKQRGRVASRKAAGQLALLQESLMLMRLVKVYLMRQFNQFRVERQLADYSRAHLRRVGGEAVYRPLLVFLGTLATAALLFVAGRVALMERLEAATLAVLGVALASLYFPLEAWVGHLKTVRRGRESAASVFEFLDRKGEVGQDIRAEFLPPLEKRLEFDDVTLREPGSGRVLLQHLSLKVEAGQKVGLVGPDDAEKHALVYLVPRFLDPSSGAIRVDGKDLRWVTLDSLCTQIGVVLQHNLIFNDTIANNIGCGEPGFTPPQIIEAAKLAHAHQFIQKLPNGYETVVGELGHSLRLGEQFRIALARAILRDPSLYIIEEPTAPLDDDTRSLVDDTFDRVLANKTVIFLPHRISTVKGCDRMFLIHKGRVEASGPHAEMLAASPLYKHLYYLEFNEFADQV